MPEPNPALEAKPRYAVVAVRGAHAPDDPTVISFVLDEPTLDALLRAAAFGAALPASLPGIVWYALPRGRRYAYFPLEEKAGRRRSLAGPHGKHLWSGSASLVLRGPLHGSLRAVPMADVGVQDDGEGCLEWVARPAAAPDAAPYRSVPIPRQDLARWYGSLVLQGAPEERVRRFSLLARVDPVHALDMLERGGEELERLLQPEHLVPLLESRLAEVRLGALRVLRHTAGVVPSTPVQPASTPAPYARAARR
jgi:hypothetical protein